MPTGSPPLCVLEGLVASRGYQFKYEVTHVVDRARLSPWKCGWLSRGKTLSIRIQLSGYFRAAQQLQQVSNGQLIKASPAPRRVAPVM